MYQFTVKFRKKLHHMTVIQGNVLIDLDLDPNNNAFSYNITKLMNELVIINIYIYVIQTS